MGISCFPYIFYYKTSHVEPSSLESSTESNRYRNVVDQFQPSQKPLYFLPVSNLADKINKNKGNKFHGKILNSHGTFNFRLENEYPMGFF